MKDFKKNDSERSVPWTPPNLNDLKRQLVLSHLSQVIHSIFSLLLPSKVWCCDSLNWYRPLGQFCIHQLLQAEHHQQVFLANQTRCRMVGDDKSPGYELWLWEHHQRLFHSGVDFHNSSVGQEWALDQSNIKMSSLLPVLTRLCLSVCLSSAYNPWNPLIFSSTNEVMFTQSVCLSVSNQPIFLEIHLFLPPLMKLFLHPSFCLSVSNQPIFLEIHLFLPRQIIAEGFC